jgi:glutamyl-tRNA reductase
VSGELFVLGLSWRTARVDVRERLGFTDDELPGAFSELLGAPSMGEAMILSTCNRIEIYGATPRGTSSSALASATAEARRFLAVSRKTPGEELAEVLYERTDEEAVRHAFRVASSLDSMVVGEAQILGQLKNAFGMAQRAGATGPILRRWMERFGDLFGKTVLVVGAGKMSALAARHLRANGAGSLVVTNRSPDKANEVAELVDGTARPWEELESLLALADVVISSTGAQQPILTRKLIKRAMKKRRYKPQVICDIAVPRDAEPDAGKIDGVYLFDIDDLQKVVAGNLKERSRHADDAVVIVEREVAQFGRWLETQAVVPTIRALREQFAAVARAEADKAITNIAAKDTVEKREQAVRRLADLIANKLLHPAMVALKDADEDMDLEALAAAARKLFDLELQQEQPAAAQDEVTASAEKREPA